MKLLDKSEIHKAKGQDRQREVAEGLKLANRVDNLREIHAQEEAALEKFRQESIKKINDEIVKKAKEKDALIKEVFQLQEERKKALEPLTEEAERLQALRKDVETTRSEVASRKEAVYLAEAQVSDEKLQLREEIARVAEERHRSHALLQEADTERTNARRTRENAEATLAQALSERAQSAKELEEERQRLAAQKESQDIIQAKLASEERELNARRLQLIDREKILERNIKRYGRRK